MNSQKDIKIIKLITSEELIGVVYDGSEYIDTSLENSADDLIFIKNPMLLESKYVKDSEAYSIYMYDWLPSIDSEFIPMHKRNILTMGTACEKLQVRYTRMLLVDTLNENIDDIDDSDIQ